MAKGIVIYHSRSGNTQLMAETIAEAMNEAGLETVCKAVADTVPEDMLEADAVVIGSPTYYGQMAAPVKQLIDESVSKHGKLDRKVGGAFTSSVNVGGGNETTIRGILEALMVHGFIVEGDPQGDHYGPVSLGKPEERALKQCKRKGKRLAELTLKLFG
ncbi:MAG: flavodoxin family protein [Sedimentisphaeraceae bacterium JB056]